MNITKKKHLLPIVALLLLLSACASGPSEEQQATLVAVAVEAELTRAAEALAPSSTPAPVDEVPPSDTPAPAAAAPTPVVVYIAAGSFSDEEKSNLQARVIDPYIDYHAGLPDHPPLVSLSLEKSDSLPDFPYSANAIFEEGITAGFLIHATAGVLDWWVPECLGPCPVSDEFRAKYPEIMAILEP